MTFLYILFGVLMSQSVLDDAMDKIAKEIVRQSLIDTFGNVNMTFESWNGVTHCWEWSNNSGCFYEDMDSADDEYQVVVSVFREPTISRPDSNFDASCKVMVESMGLLACIRADWPFSLPQCEIIEFYDQGCLDYIDNRSLNICYVEN